MEMRTQIEKPKDWYIWSNKQKRAWYSKQKKEQEKAIKKFMEENQLPLFKDEDQVQKN
jgi:hypothetical protein